MKRQKFIRKCSNEECNGFLSSKWKCSLCSTWTCSECNINVGTFENKQAHVCNVDDVETAKLLKSDSRSCPKCFVLIFKISGCNQMFCTNCKTAFCWRTGEIYHGTSIHNPHYFEYMAVNNQRRQRERDPNANCTAFDSVMVNDLRKMMDILTVIENSTIKKINVNEYLFIRTQKEIPNYEENNIISVICIKMLHLREVVIRDLNISINDANNYNERNRVQYMLNQISENVFKKNIQMTEKKKQKMQEYLVLFDMVYETVSDLMRNVFNVLMKVFKKYPKVINLRELNNNYYYFAYLDLNKIHTIACDVIKELDENNCLVSQLENELINLAIYANNCLNNISQTYKCTHKQFNEVFELINVPKNKKMMNRNDE